jgi:hypothetical protein
MYVVVQRRDYFGDVVVIDYFADDLLLRAFGDFISVGLELSLSFFWDWDAWDGGAVCLDLSACRIRKVD